MRMLSKVIFSVFALFVAFASFANGGEGVKLGQGYMVPLVKVSEEKSTSVLPESAKRGRVEVLKSVTLKKGDTCYSATKKVGRPLSAEGCEELLASVGRSGHVDRRNLMMQIVFPPYFWVGDKLFFVRSGGKEGWIMIPANRV